MFNLEYRQNENSDWMILESNFADFQLAKEHAKEYFTDRIVYFSPDFTTKMIYGTATLKQSSSGEFIVHLRIVEVSA
jgi:hypothetical protein